MWATDNGMLERNPNDLTAGVTFPKGTSTVIHAAGIVWGGQVHDGSGPVIRIGGQTYNQGTVAGRILSPGIVENPENADVRIYRIRRDWATADLTEDAGETFGIPTALVTAADVQRLRAMYQKDWLEWPWQKGAPYYERNGIPGYQPDSSGIVDSTTDEPGVASADQVIWFVTNDLGSGASFSLYGSPPIGLEDQITCWAYSHLDSLQNVIFQRHRLIYKGTGTTPSTAVIDSMYIGKWADPDVGDYADDEVGYMTDRQVEYAYNAVPVDAEYAKFNLTPPVVGYGYVQGPRVPSVGSSANWNLTPVSGYRNLPATMFTYFTSPDRPSDYLTGSYSSSLAWYNILQGYRPTPVSPQQCMTDYLSGSCTDFELTGDPQSYQGWVDGVQESPGDRRFFMASGPCTLAFGDTQEVIFSLVAAIGADNRSGISVVKEYAGKAHDQWQFNFSSPAAIPPPDVRVVELDQKLILDWESDTAQMRRSEGYLSHGYRFQAYKVYQFPATSKSLQDAVVYQVVDPTQSRYIYLTQDKLRNRMLINGQKYYFAVTAAAYNGTPGLSAPSIESQPIIVECTPHAPNPGTVYPYHIFDTISNVRNIRGYDDAFVSVSYYDPTRPDGHTYKVEFHRSHDPLTDIDEKPRWTLTDSTLNDTLVSNALTDDPAIRVLGKGFTVRAQLPYFGLKGVYQVQYGDLPRYDFVFNAPNPEGNLMVVGAGTSSIDTIQGATADDIDTEIRFNGDSSWALFRGANVPQSRWVRVPFTAWRVGLNGADTINAQAFAVITKAGNDSIWRSSVLLDRSYKGKTLKVFYPITVIVDSLNVNGGFYLGQYHDDVTTRPDAALYKGIVFTQSVFQSTKASVREAYIADLDDDGIGAPKGTTIRFVRWKQIKDQDQKVYVPVAVTTTNVQAAKAAMANINVFPNPYYGFNRAEISATQKFVTFSHLPKTATIRIFNLTGDMVRVVHKDDDTQFATWDLNNATGLPVGGGIYLAHISLQDQSGADLGTKILKLMIVPENQQPRN